MGTTAPKSQGGSEDAGGRRHKELVQSMDSGSHSTNISFFPSFLQTPTLHTASRMGTGTLVHWRGCEVGKGYTAQTESDKSYLCHLLAGLKDGSGHQCPHLSDGMNDTFLTPVLQDRIGGRRQKAP